MPDNLTIGPGSEKSQIQSFHDFLLSDIGNIPLASQWVIQIDKLPAALDNNLSSPDVDNLEAYNWFVDGKAKAIKKAISDGVFIDKGVCIFAQGVQTPQESLRIDRIGPNDEFHGGLLSAPVSKGRDTLQELNIAFLETNYSFLDFIVRPWIIYGAHYGLMARKPDDPKNIKTTIQIYFYDRGSSGVPKIRKKFKFYNAVPTRVEGIISTWDDTDVKKVYTSWTYSHYDVAAENIADVLTGMKKNNIINQQLGFKVPTMTLPTESMGSGALSKSFSIKSIGKLGSQSGSIVGGSYSSAFGGG